MLRIFVLTLTKAGYRIHGRCSLSITMLQSFIIVFVYKVKHEWILPILFHEKFWLIFNKLGDTAFIHLLSPLELECPPAISFGLWKFFFLIFSCRVASVCFIWLLLDDIQVQIFISLLVLRIAPFRIVPIFRCCLLNLTILLILLEDALIFGKFESIIILLYKALVIDLALRFINTFHYRSHFSRISIWMINVKSLP